MTTKKIKILFIGTSDFGIPTLNTLNRMKDYTILGCVTAPDKPVGRKQKLTASPIKTWAKKHKIPVIQPERIKDPVSVEKVQKLAPDMILVSAYGQIIPKEIFQPPRLGAINIHPSLLPQWRGASPIQYAILSGDKKTGVTLIQMDEQLDHGPIVSRQELSLQGNEYFEDLYLELQKLSQGIIKKTLPFLRDKKIDPAPQNESEATYSKILKREDGKLIWSRTAEELERQIRAFHQWPESFTGWGKAENETVKIKITKASVETSETIEQKDLSYGQVFVTPEKKLAVETGKGYLIIEKLKLEGKKEITAQEFLNGYPAVIGSTLI